MKELKTLLETLKFNPEISISEITNIIGIKANKYTDISFFEELFKEFKIVVPSNLLFVFKNIFCGSYEIIKDKDIEYHEMCNEFKSIFESKIDYSKMKLPKEFTSDNEYDWSIRHKNRLLNEFRWTKKVTRLYSGSENVPYISRYFVKNNLYNLDVDSNNQMRFGRGSIVGKCIPVENLPSGIVVGTEFMVLNPRSNKEVTIKILNSQNDCDTGYFALINGKEEIICNSEEVYDAYDALFDVNRYIFCNYNWKKRLLIFK